MQTFLPSPDLARSARVLDRQRLGKQRVECLQILRALTGEANGWARHPAVRMWAGYEGTLVAYGLAVCAEWTARGYRDTCAAKIRALAAAHGLERRAARPPWLGCRQPPRSNLLRKAPEHYRQFRWRVRDDLPYVWPQVPAPAADKVLGG